MEIVVNWEEIDSEEMFYEKFLPQVSAPEWHGRNLDALADSVVTGDVNGIEPPYVIKNINSCKSPEIIKEFQLKVLEVFSEAAMKPRGIKVVIEWH